MEIKVGNIDLFSSVEYFNRSAAVVYLAGCNFRCPWCWSYDMLEEYSGREIEVSELVKEIEEDPSEIEAVVVDGGEPTQQQDALIELCTLLKEKDYLVQLNTNGTNPEVVDELGIKGKIDRLGLDIKAPLDFERRYSKLIGRKMKHEFKESIKEILRASSLCGYELEPRTTIVPKLTDSRHWISKIAQEISMYTDNYVIQAFTPEKGTLSAEYEEMEEVTREQLIELAGAAKRHIPNVMIKTRETGLEKI